MSACHNPRADSFGGLCRKRAGRFAMAKLLLYSLLAILMSSDPRGCWCESATDVLQRWRIRAK